eukprot:EC725091.1.p2 GENE.EC725091.1~~EC725091.1.p2  ORF type:complete len:116 (+),score=18.42 EC725091.1:203-550(+)
MPQMDFSAKRLVVFSQIPPSQTRGNHAHLRSRQMISVVQGRVTVRVHDGERESVTLLDADPTAECPDYIFIEPLCWVVASDFSADAIVLLLGTEPYDESELVRDHSEFLRLKARA